MTSKKSLRTIQDSEFPSGFRNLLRKDSGEWWNTRKGLLHLLLWTVLMGGALVIRLFRGAEADLIIYTYTFGTGFLTSIGILIVMQDAIVSERESGTASWLLSKPVSRAAFILSKLVANGTSLILVMIVVQGVVAYAVVSVAGGSPGVGNWIVGMALLALNLTFYLTLTLLLGTLFTGRGPIVGIPIAILLVFYVITKFVPEGAQIMPLALVFQPAGESQMSLALEAMLGRPLTMALPIVATIVWCVLFTVTAIWRFRKEEF
jgi:ABC-2 type transport system permease protein